MRIILIIISSLIGGLAVAQHDTLSKTVMLPNAEVAAEAVQPDPFLKEGPDSLLMEALPPTSVGELLAVGSTMNVRRYGPAGTAITANGRGLSGDHVNVLWNGIPLQSPSLGLTDLGALPAQLFSEISILRGGRISFVNAGGSAGIIWLDSRKEDFDQSVRVGYDDLLNASIAGKVNIPLGKRWKSSTSIQSERNRNEFSYRDPLLAGRPEMEQTHNNFNRFSLLQQFSGEPLEGLKTDAAIWLQQSSLHIPEMLGSYGQSFATQRDSSLRINSGISYENGVNRFSLRAAIFEEAQHYSDRMSQDAPLSVNSKIRTQRQYYRMAYAHESASFNIRVGYDIHRESARISSYAGGKQHRLLHGPQAALTYRFKQFRADFSGRYDFGTSEALPVANLKVEYQRRILRFFAAIKNTFRNPDLNELFWQPGGNPNLLPERGNTAELGVAFDQVRGLSGQALIYGQRMERLILWEPGAQGWMARNQKNVDAAGFEGLLRHVIDFRQHRINQVFRANIQVNNLDAEELTKAFYPALQIRYSIHYAYKGWTLGGALRSVSNGFTYAQLNSNFGNQDALLLGDVFAGYRFERSDYNLVLSLAVRNAGDVMDFRIARTAAPGRILSINLQWIWNTSNNH